MNIIQRLTANPFPKEGPRFCVFCSNELQKGGTFGLFVNDQIKRVVVYGSCERCSKRMTPEKIDRTVKKILEHRIKAGEV